MNRLGFRRMDWLATGVWGAFLWSIVLTVSHVVSGSYYAAVRGVGIVGYSSDIVVFSQMVDRYFFLGLGIVVLVFHSAYLRQRGGSDLAGIVGSLGLAGGLAGFELLNPAFVVVVAGSFALIVWEDSAKISTALRSSRKIPLAVLALWLMAVLAVVSAAAAARWVIGGFDGAMPLSDPSWGVAVVGLQLLGLIYQVLPQLALLFFFAWALRLALASELHIEPWVGDLPEGSSPTAVEGSHRLKGPWPLVLLGAGLALAVFVGVYPYLPAVNPSSMLVGVDVRHCYSYWLKDIPGSTICGRPGFSLGNDRVGALWALQGLMVLTGSADRALKVAPPIWGMLLVLSTYLLVREGTGDGFPAGVAALLAGVSTQVVGGIDAGLLANWLGMSLAFVFFAVVLRGMRLKKLVYLAPSLVLFAALLFIHPWTWAVTLVVLGAYLIVDLLQSTVSRSLRDKRFEIGLIVALLALGLGVDLLKSMLPSGSGLSVALKTVSNSVGPSNVTNVVSNLQQSLLLYLGGAQGDSVWFVLGLVGVIAVPSLRGRFGKLLLVWVSCLSIGVLFVGPPSNLLQSRIIYDTPLQIFAAIGLVAVINSMQGVLRGTGRVGERLSKLAPFIIIVAVVGLALGFALDYVGFLYQ